MSFDLTAMQQELAERGMASYQQQPNQLVVSRQRGPVGPDRGNSFWICRIGGNWYISTWLPHVCRVPAGQSIVEVCEAFVDVGTKAQYRVPDDLVARFSLVEIDVDEFDRLWDSTAPT